MRWDQLDLGAGVWTKPAAATKQKAKPPGAALGGGAAGAGRHRSDKRVGLSGTGESGHREAIKAAWPAICRAAGLAGPDGKPTVRIHDLRHTYASILASSGLSLPIIGALLGHSQAATTQRYAHLLDDPLRAATERVGALVTGGDTADVVPISGSSR